MSEKEGKGKAETWAQSLVRRMKGGFVWLHSYQVRTRDSSLCWARTAKFVLYAALPTTFFLHITKLPLFLRNSFCWCSDQVFKPGWNLYGSRDYHPAHAINPDASEARTKTFLYSKDKPCLYDWFCPEALVCTNKSTLKLKHMNIKKKKIKQITWRPHWIPNHTKSWATVIKLEILRKEILIISKLSNAEISPKIQCFKSPSFERLEKKAPVKKGLCYVGNNPWTLPLKELKGSSKRQRGTAQAQF